MERPLNVLIVEDSEDDSLLVLRELRRAGYTPIWERIETADTMHEALKRQHWDIIIADHSLPRFSAPEALKLIQGYALDLPFIIVSGTIGEEVAVEAMRAGAHDFVLKGHLARLGPAIARELREAATRREERRAQEAIRHHEQELAQAYDETLAGWSRALELRDHETEGHSLRVTELTVALARRLNMSGPALIHIKRGALLHDIGKMGIPDAILSKPGPLNDAEWQIMRQHPNYAYEMLKPIAYLRHALDIPYCHHERWNGSGYPQGLKGEDIPLAARIFAVADVWDALTSDRPYRNAWSAELTSIYLREQAGILFDPQIVATFLEMIKE